MAISRFPACGICKHWRPVPASDNGQCVWLMCRTKPYWLAEVKLTHKDWGTACAAFEEKAP
jgi:hypothetical protein